jgi:hypothetical protein
MASCTLRSSFFLANLLARLLMFYHGTPRAFSNAERSTGARKIAPSLLEAARTTRERAKANV